MKLILHLLGRFLHIMVNLLDRLFNIMVKIADSINQARRFICFILSVAFRVASDWVECIGGLDTFTNLVTRIIRVRSADY